MSPLDVDQPLDGGSLSPARRDNSSILRRVLSTIGPGLMVCFADTDGSCLITAADSGSKWRYKLLLLQVALIPTLYVAQELTVRLALFTGKGTTALVRQEVGKAWAWIVALPLLADCFLALISEIDVIGQTMLVCWHIPLSVTTTVFIACLMGLVLTGSYSFAERVGLAMGCLQVFFFATVWMNHPKGNEVVHDLGSFPLSEPNFVKLVTANIGAVIMPWMLAYQQSALCEKGIGGEHASEHLLIEQIDTGIGSFLTQGVMAAMLITVAASPKFSGEDIETMDQLLSIFADTLGGETRAKFCLTFAVCGACIVAAIVVTLCGAWALEEALGREVRQVPHTYAAAGTVQRMAHKVRERPVFFTAYAGTCAVAWVLTVMFPDLAVALTGVWTQFINGLLMPPLVFALWYLAAYKLPEAHRLSTFRRRSLFAVFAVCSGFCILSIPFAIQDSLQGS
eukprot:gnl/TRDRNA2_/TRDRNA2_202420_c0_seq1.p1 gnl/TRDRNA2_/TRDRNA2_202420_c0~~gnl/TRDRNA2_/TRDRNA2_202420_c0_seq1.p1  ORF type:complete len:453 (-),score=61.98 gnl/TRDRNA2_/TRDRNA2_202420_c0_seq1:61-1419(-)